MVPPVEQPSLTVLSGSMGGTVFVVDDSVDNILIGSDGSCSFALPGTGVDPIHARLWIDLEGITVYDTNSPRGVYINDDRVRGQARLRNGDVLWLGHPGDDQSVMLQCRLPGAAAPPELEPTVAMMAIDLDPTVSLIAKPLKALSVDDTPSEPTLLLAPDAIQPEPTVMQAPEDAFTEPEATIVMLPDDLELSEDGGLEMKPAAKRSERIEEPPPTVTGWDATAGGITAASDPPWMAGAPASIAAPEPAPTVAAPPPVPRRDLEPPPLPVAAPKPAAKPAAPPVARAPERPPAPKPRREAPAGAVTPPPRRREAARPPDDEPMAPTPRKGAPLGLLIGGGLLAAAVVAAGGWWMLTRGPATAPEGGTVAPPPTVADAPPATHPPAAADPEVPQPAPAADVPVADAPVEEQVTIVAPPRAAMSPSPVPSRAPATAPSPTQVAAARPPVTTAPAAPPPAVVAAGLVGRAEAARSAGDLDGAAELFDQALRTDPQNAAATSGKAAVTAARAAARKAFMPGRTVVQTQSAKSDMAGFDTADVSVKKAPDFSGRIEFAVNPPRVKPGDNYAVQIYLVNEGKKAIKVGGVSVTTNLNGSKSGRPVASPVKEVAPSQRALLGELPGVWPEEVSWWSTEVMVTANKGDSLKNLLTWK